MIKSKRFVLDFEVRLMTNDKQNLETWKHKIKKKIYNF